MAFTLQNLGTTSDGLPVADGFDFPVGKREDYALPYSTHKIDSLFVDPEYLKLFGVWHPGEDWNGKAGGDNDIGDPVYAIAHGKVITAKYFEPSWGNIVLLAHALPSGERVWSQYAHLDQITVRTGQTVQRGDQVGTIGKGAKTAQHPRGIFPAHLHFEIRRRSMPAQHWLPMVKSRDEVRKYYYDPTAFIRQNRPTNINFLTKYLGKPLLAFDTNISSDPFSSFQKAPVSNWFRADVGFQGEMLWTYAASRTETNWVRWQANLPHDSQWEVMIFIPSQHATTKTARYKLRYEGGEKEIVIDQSKYFNDWVSLGTYPFKQGDGQLKLSDLTGDTKKGVKVAFDAVCWVDAA